MGFFAEAGPVQIFVSNHVSIIKNIQILISVVAEYIFEDVYCLHSLFLFFIYNLRGRNDFLVVYLFFNLLDVLGGSIVS